MLPIHMGNRKGSSQRGLFIIPDLERATHAVSVYLQGKHDLVCSQAETNVLAFLHAQGRSSLSNVHASFGHRRSTLTNVIDRLEGRKLIMRERDPSDGRAFKLSLTRAGTALARVATAYLSRLESRTAARVTSSDLQAFVKVATALVEAAEERK
jgi:DNA-binding MarR family transcriptional regulator